MVAAGDVCSTVRFQSIEVLQDVELGHRSHPCWRDPAFGAELLCSGKAMAFCGVCDGRRHQIREASAAAFQHLIQPPARAMLARLNNGVDRINVRV